MTTHKGDGARSQRVSQSALLRRARLMLDQSPFSSEISAFFSEASTMESLLAAASSGRPPAAIISRPLLASIPHLQEDRGATRRIGLLIAGILDDAGFEPDRRRVRITDPLFTTAATYRRKPSAIHEPSLEAQPQPHDEHLLKRLARTFTREEAAQLIQALLNEYPDLANR